MSIDVVLDTLVLPGERSASVIQTNGQGYELDEEVWKPNWHYTKTEAVEMFQKPESVVFRIALTSNNVPTLSAALPGELIKIDELPVTPEISVELTGSAGLDIDPQGRIVKRVSDAAPTSWEWKVTPVGTGEQFLNLKNIYTFSGG